MNPSDQYQLISAQVHHTSSPSGIRAQDHPDPYFSSKIRISSWNRPQFSLGHSGFVTVSKRMQGNNTAIQQNRKTLSILRLEAAVTHLNDFTWPRVQGVQEQQVVHLCKQEIRARRASILLHQEKLSDLHQGRTGRRRSLWLHTACPWAALEKSSPAAGIKEIATFLVFFSPSPGTYSL